MSSRSSSPDGTPSGSSSAGEALALAMPPAKKIRKLKIGVVVSTFNREVAGILLEGCRESLRQAGIRAWDERLVAGALEIPYMVKKMALRRDKKAYDGFVALGCVVRGETYHFNVVCDVSAAGLQDVQLETMIPVVNGILTTETLGQAKERAKGKPAHCVAALLSLLA